MYGLWVSVVAPEVQLWKWCKWCQTSMYATESRFLTWGLGTGDLVGDLDRRGEWDLALRDLPSSDLKETTDGALWRKGRGDGCMSPTYVIGGRLGPDGSSAGSDPKRIESTGTNSWL